ncbi:MAG: hypothetical protein RR980_04155 [Mucinivorans sp.]
MKNKKLWLIGAMTMISLASWAQEDTLSLPEKNAQRLSILDNDFGKWGRLKISGYLQGQWQWAESKGAAAFADGGSFGSRIDNRFMIRRGRIKFAYSVGIVQAVFQPDFTEKGVKIKDAYIAVTAPSKIIGGQLGVFDRPFGYEISYSSSLRESPERSRVFLSLFPDERDLGAMATLKYGEFTLNGGVFNGTGVASENDSHKDFIGRLAWLKQTANAQVGLAFSYYGGGVTASSEQYYTYNKAEGFKAESQKPGAIHLRQYFGASAQYLQMWGAGTTNLRAEFLWGQQPGTEKNNNMVSGGTPDKADLYLRNFMGGYAILVQDIGRSKHSLVLKYDYYDPNTKVSGNQIGQLAGTSAADIAYSTFGVGYLFRWNNNLRLMAYYDMVSNEKTENLADFKGRIHQNVLTIRAQVKF